MSYKNLITGRLSLALLLPPLTLAACGDDGQGDDEAGTETTAGESGDSGTDGTEAGTDDQGTTETDGAEQGGTDESDTGSNETDTGGTDTGGEVDPEIVELCEAGCALVEECTEPAPDCLQECIDTHTQYADDPECLALEKALTECIGGLTCDEFLQEDPPPCEAEFEATCDGGQPPVCMVGIGEGNGPGECSVSVECENEPVYEVVCAGNQQGCTCFEDGQEVGGCGQAMALCGDLDTFDAVNECCGWGL